MNTVFVNSHTPAIASLAIDIPGTSYSIFISKQNTLDIVSNFVLLMVRKVTKNYKSLSKEGKKTFTVAKRDEIDFLLRETVTPIPLHQGPYDIEHQVSKCVLAVKTSSEIESVTR